MLAADREWFAGQEDVSVVLVAGMMAKGTAAGTEVGRYRCMMGRPPSILESAWDVIVQGVHLLVWLDLVVGP